jgi:hypothetical protein
MIRAYLAIAVFIFSADSKICHAEIFQNINYMETLGQIKTKFPNAKYEKVYPAWLEKYNSLISIEGPGLGVVITIVFFDQRIIIRDEIDKQNLSQNDITDRFKKVLKLEDDYALRVKNVRVIYTDLIPMSTFKKRYGAPAKCEHNENFEFKCIWPKKNMLASMTNDGNSVEYAESWFTEKEKKIGIDKIK